ncbi:phosphatase PAP2 family protein [Turneriella parva]|uniref:Phosphoesterase PA-phosphatase related protein n=1 Tax=Turneriella parva (strain ATCC BAA-1111 / DSM 21527 / NCTC 11395 / H) TaxID=869212 RepID=I4B3F4_TURPD|nr:phosphatase PAP2 family protein [Turneriella parva]AFM11811.1 phosphoesterase PA-phosphatase related protein [Turneriella parva DSM 21527]
MFLIDLDKRVFEYLTLWANPPWLSAVCEKLGDWSTYTIPAITFCALYYWLNSPRFLRFLLVLIVILVASEATAQLIKHLVARPRPAIEWLIYVDPKALSFPSAHAVNTMALAFLLSRWFEKSILWYLPIPVIIGASRVLANYHYPLDVIGGWIIGYSVAAVFWGLLAKIWSRRPAA